MSLIVEADSSEMIPQGALAALLTVQGVPLPFQEIGVTHMRVVEGLTSKLQLDGLLARLCKVATAKPAI
jgi:hypothetical protein